MLNLALDTATRHGRFALAEGGQVLVTRPLNVSGSYADALLPVILDLLATAGRGKEELTGIGVTTGPGSFTGIRIGVATAKGLAWGLGCRLVGVTSLDAMAAALLADDPAAELAVPVLDARRGEVFAGLYRRAGAWVEPVLAATAATPDAWWQSLVGVVPDLNRPVFGGDGITLLLGQGPTLRPELDRGGAPVLRRWSTSQPDTAAALAVAMASADLPLAHPFSLVPDYMRVSDAEVKRRLDLTPSEPSDEITSYASRRPDRG